MINVFIDGKAGTTGLRIEERLSSRDDINIVSLPETLRKDIEARREIINSSDVVFLCLPDDAAREAVSLVENDRVVIIDASTAHRTNPVWAYGFPELSPEHEEKIRTSNKIAVPGCHASGFIALVYPLVKAGIISPDAHLFAHSLTGYSGGGKKMIADYESPMRDPLLGAPRQYGITQMHKHLPEMTAITGLATPPIFSPIVASFYSGMEVTVPLFASDINGTINDIKDIYSSHYNSDIIKFVDGISEGGFLSAGAYSGLDSMGISVYGNDDRILLVARYDNLGKGASGAAVECLNVRIGVDKEKTLVL